MLLFLFLLSNSIVTVIIDRNERKENLSQKQNKKQSEIN